MTQDSLTHLCAYDALRTQPSPIRDICSLVNQPEMRSLAGGWPDPKTFPIEETRRIVVEILEDHEGKVLQYGSTEGLLELRQELARQAREEGDTECQPDEIMITHGSTQGMDLVSRVFVDPGDVVMVEMPSYFGAFGAVTSSGGDVIGVPLDDDGLETKTLAQKVRQLKREGKRIKGVYVIPNFQNPTGLTLSLDRRKHLISIAEEFDLMIFEDDPYGELRFEGERIPSLKSMDGSGRVIHMRSFSKSFAPGIRVAWLSARANVMRRMAIMKQFVDACTNTLGQYIIYEFLRRGLLKERIGLLIAHYRRKRDFMIAQLEKHFPAEVHWTRPKGGFFIWVRLPERIDATELLTGAISRKVVFVVGPPFFPNGGGRNTLRLSYSQVGEEEMEPAVAALGHLIKKSLSRLYD